MKALIRNLSLSILIVLISGAIMFAQDGQSMKEKNMKDIATFGTMSTNSEVPVDLMSEIDNQVVTAIEELKRFRVQGLQKYRFQSDDIQEFISTVQKYRLEKGKNQTADQRFAGVSLTGEEFDKLMQAFLVAIPVVSNYTIKYDTKEVVQAKPKAKKEGEEAPAEEAPAEGEKKISCFM